MAFGFADYGDDTGGIECSNRARQFFHRPSQSNLRAGVRVNLRVLET